MAAGSVRELALQARDREEILCRLDELRLWWAEAAAAGTPPYDQLLLRVHDLRGLLAAYFNEQELAWRGHAG